MNIYELDGQTHTQQTVPKNLETTISFVASSKTGDQTCILLLPEGTSIEIFPQTQMSFLAQYPKISIEKKQGQAKYIASDNYSPWQLFLTGISKQDAQKNQFQQDFETKKIQSIGEQGEGIFMQNAYLKAVNK